LISVVFLARENSSIPRIDNEDGAYSSGCTLSYWLDSIERPKFPKLTDNKTCDFLIVGAGIGKNCRSLIWKEKENIFYVL